MQILLKKVYKFNFLDNFKEKYKKLYLFAKISKIFYNFAQNNF